MLKNAGFSGGSDSKETSRNAGDLGSVPGLGRSLADGSDFPLQGSCLENSMDRGAWWATVHEVAKSQTRLSDLTHTHTHTRAERSLWSQRPGPFSLPGAVSLAALLGPTAAKVAIGKER